MKLFSISKFIISLIMGLLIAGPIGAAIGGGLSLIPKGSSGLMADLFPEVWTGEMVKALRGDDQAQFLSRIPSYDQYATNDVIHLVDVGADPDVLINNTTYPIDVQELPDQDISISLDKYQTKATKVTDDELFAINYDKMGSVIERHKIAIQEKKYDKAVHALAPQANSASTPVVATTGVVVDGTRRMLTRKDIITLKKKFDAIKVPTSGRILVLCSDHVNDLLTYDQKFADQYYNYTTGKVANLYSFEVYTYTNCPLFNGSTLAKKAFGAEATDGDYQASVAFFAPRMFKASGTTKAYLQDASTSPTTQENLANFRHYFICLPKKQEAIGAIASAYVTEASQSDNTNIETSDSLVVLDIEVESVLVAEDTTVNGIIAVIDSTDGSTQAYVVTDSSNVPRAGSATLVTGDKLVVTAENGVQKNTYVITVDSGD